MSTQLFIFVLFVVVEESKKEKQQQKDSLIYFYLVYFYFKEKNKKSKVNLIRRREAQRLSGEVGPLRRVLDLIRKQNRKQGLSYLFSFC